MNLISIRKKRRPAIALLLCTGLLGACPPDAVADAGDRLPVPEIQQSKSPVKRTLVGTVTDASTGETLIGVNVIIKGTTQGTVTDLDGKFSISLPKSSSYWERCLLAFGTSRAMVKSSGAWF